jgi:enoyl-CoA hydratase/carnithine racemase
LDIDSMSILLKQRVNRVQVLTLNRPETGNRISESLAREMIATLDDAERNDDIGAVVLTGTGDKFCIGGDHTSGGSGTQALLDFADAFGAMTVRMNTFGKPLLGAVNGDAHAGGFSVLTCCDLAVMSEDATIALPELAHGLFPVLAMATAQRVVARKLFFELAYEGRRLTAEEARALWLVNEVVPGARVLPQTIERAQKIAEAPASSLRLGRSGYSMMQRGDLDTAILHAKAILPLVVSMRG